MRVGFFAALFLSGFAAVLAAPPAVQQRDLADNVESAVDTLLGINIASIASEAVPIAESVFQEATSFIGGVLASNTALGAEATSIFAEATSFLGPAATGIANEVHEVVTSSNAATQGSVARPLAMGAAAVLGSMVLGAYAVL